jgi:outer membrane protein
MFLGRAVLAGIVCVSIASAASAAIAQDSTPGATTPPAAQPPSPTMTPARGDTMRLAPATAVESLLVAPPTGPGEVWSLARCIQAALKQNADVIAARAAAQRASGSALSGWSGIIPSLDLGASYGQSRPAQNPVKTAFSFVDSAGVTRTASATLNRDESKGYHATLSSNIIDMPSILGKSRLDRLQGAAESDENETRNSVVFQVKTQYFEYLKADRLAIVARETEKLARDEETRAQALFTVGTVARGDVLKAKARRATTQADRLQAENDVLIQQGKLKQLLGIPASSAIVVEPMLDTGIVIPDSAASIQQALASRPQIAAARQAESAAHSGVSSAQSQHLPSVAGSIGLDYNESDSNYDNFETTGGLASDNFSVSRINRNWNGEVHASLPIFSGGLIEGNVRQAKANLLEAETNYRQRVLDVTVEVQQAWLTLRVSVQRIDVAREGLASAEEDYKFSKGRYDLGAGTYLDLLTAEVQLAQARTSLVQAVADARVAEAGLEFAIGQKQY